MVRRFRMIAGPNGSGKSTLRAWLSSDYVATETPLVNLTRIANRATLGGHAVPEEKTRARHARSLELLPSAFPFLSRAFFFDNSTDEMRYLASWDADSGMCVQQVALPSWFETMRKGLNQ